jgi:hypothetical protein
MEATLGISWYRCLYPKLAKTPCLSYYLLCFLFNKIGEEGGTGSAWKCGVGGGGGVGGWGAWGGGGITYTHVSKCKNYKIKGKEKLSKYNSFKLLVQAFCDRDNTANKYNMLTVC